jgi:hypothetical protein
VFVNAIIKQVRQTLDILRCHLHFHCLSCLVRVQNVTSCYFYDQCNLCGINPVRGVCISNNGIAKCQCLVNNNNPSKPYTGEFCFEQEPILSVMPSTPTQWTPIVVGILAGLAGLLCAVACCLLAVAAWRRRRRHPTDK